MASILDQINEYPTRRYEPGDVLLDQDTSTGKLFFLAEGAVEVIKDGQRIAIVREMGAVFGEMSAFSKAPHAATVRAIEPSVFHIIDDARETMKSNTALCFHVCGIMARRMEMLIGYLANVTEQYQGHDHLSMVGSVLESLMRPPARPRIRPSDSTIRKGQTPD